MNIKKLYFIPLCLLLLLGMAGCDRNADRDITDPTETSVESETASDAVKTAMTCLRSVLEDQTPLQNNGQTLSHLLDMPSATFSLVDMDGDGLPEAVVQDLDDVVVIYCDGESAYAADFTFRTMYNVQKDGRYGWTVMSAEGHWYGESRLEFDGAEFTEEILWMIENDGEPNAAYHLRGKEVTQAELRQYLDTLTHEKVAFQPLNAEHIRAAFEEFSK